MQIKFFCPHWGQEHLGQAVFLEKVKVAGYDGVEMVVAKDARVRNGWKRNLDKHELLFIAQVIEPGDNGPFEQYLRETRFYLQNARAMDPLKINVFTGRDYFSFEQNSLLIQETLDFAQENCIAIVQETHRGRFAYSAACIEPYLGRFPSLRFNADFSHWCCVSESYLQQPEFSAIIDKVIQRSDHIHARVGYPQGPQVNDPRAPEWKAALDHHLRWWDLIVELHAGMGSEILTITPEFGPVPYLQALPFTQAAVADQWEINVWMMELLRKRYHRYCA